MAGWLAAIPRADGNLYVISGRIKGKEVPNLNGPQEVVCERTGLKDMRINDARHSYATKALALGESLPMICRLLSHTLVKTTARYAHLVEGFVRESTVRISEKSADLLLFTTTYIPIAVYYKSFVGY